jgi:hypothetical protein
MPTPAPTVAGPSTHTLLAATWNAGPWSQCQSRQHQVANWVGQCNPGCAKTRPVSCVSTSTGNVVDDSHCVATMKLAESQVCECPEGTPCMDQCEPGFLSTGGHALTCETPILSYYCGMESSSDPKLASIVRERCPATCGLCP